ncbi:spindle pole body component [Grosmannia clavigera kw1407]|uniref:Spindle pole body component n=1 Tax=Grosmannia clavigera (strain kw1407 / UAMH 11150) TaxID=655863 RepID=F0XLG1_GROCL|nr:spindle pole body component [Grosmannia clavigera kw1407]EFX01498.1 spindle pole body component [Grosmannia clavigera kw1407]
MSSTAGRAQYNSSHANSNASGGEQRPEGTRSRMSQAQSSVHSSFRSGERPDGKYREAPPQVSYASTAHKRTASGNPRTAGRPPAGGGGGARAGTPSGAPEHGGERRTERTVITTRDMLVSRARSSERRGSAAGATKESRAAAAAAAAAATAALHKTLDGRGREATSAAMAAAAAAAPAAEAAVPWNPEAMLLPHTSAPLASRISVPPLAAQMPASLQPRPLSSMTLEQQEAAMLDDLLGVFMGCEGQYIRFGTGYDPHEERDRLSGPPWRILGGLDPSLQDLTVVMLRSATHYVALEAFVDVQSREGFGLVNHALCAAVRRFLQDYVVLIAQLETQFLTDTGFTLHVLNMHMLPTSQMMLQLYALAHELLKKNALLDDDDESEVSSDDGADDYDKIINQLRDGGELVPGNATTKKICKGGAVLETITRRLEAMSGDPAARALLTALLREASRPYMVMLNEWLHHGGISDPHGEFLVKEQKSIRREVLKNDYTDEYWDRRYTLRDKDVPSQLAGAIKDKVLLAGKYLNVVRECGGVDTSKQVMDVPTSFDDSRFLDNINTAYGHANGSLLQLLLTTHALPARLRSLKHYFFLDPADYFSYFLELGHNELRKRSIRAVNTGKLQSLLDLVLRQPGSAVSLDPFKEDVKVEMNETTLVQALQRVVNITGIDQGEVLQLSMLAAGGSGSMDASGSGGGGGSSSSSGEADGYASLQLDYAVPFPVSLVISRKTIWRYQALFRFLLSLHHLGSQLTTTWQAQMGELAWFHRSSSRDVAAWKRRLWTLRARMLVFVQQLLAFCTAEVIEPNWQALMSRLGGGDGQPAALPGRTVDELMQDHVDFLDTCLKECMLTNSKLLKIHAKLMQTCFSFVNFASYLTRNMDKIDRDLAGPAQPKDATPAQWAAFQQMQAQRQPDTAAGASTATSASAAADEETRSLVERLAKYEHHFGRNLQVLLDALNHYAATETVVLLSLCARLSTANQGSEYSGLRHEEELL